VDYVREWSDKSEIPKKQILKWMKVPEGTYYKWRKAYGKVYEHNGWIPRDHWLTDDERQAIVKFHLEHPLEGYRCLTFMMLDANVVACSPATVYRVLRAGGHLRRWNRKPSKKGNGFHQPDRPHRHWHVDIAYVNIVGTFYFLCTVLDGYSRYIVHWEIREKMEEIDVETIIQRAREKFPGEHPRIITDNGPQFVSKDFKQYIRICGMTHVRTSPYYPQSNGKLERYHRTIKSTCLRPGCPLTREDAQCLVTRFVTKYNDERLHSAIGYIAPRDMLLGREKEIFAERERKLEAARKARAEKRAQQREKRRYNDRAPAEDRATLRSDPSADRGAKTSGRAAGSSAPPPAPPTGILGLAPCDKPSQHDAATSSTGCPTTS